MPNIAGTLVPAQITAVCPRCHVNRVMFATGTLTYWCGGCEYEVTIGAGGSPLATSALTTAGATALPFASGGTQFSPGQYLYYAGATPEIVMVTGATSATSVPVNALQYNHATAQNVSLATPVLTLTSVENINNAPPWGF